MTDDPPFDPLLLERYLADALSPAERAQVGAWLSTHPATAQLLRDLPRAVLGSAQHADTEAAWQLLTARIAAAPRADDLADRRVQHAAAQPASLKRSWLRRASAVAAALVVLVGGVATWRATRGGELVAPNGHDVTATLPDGSRLILAAGSRATWPATFGAAARIVSLEGQAWFDVVHDATRPFRVVTRDAVAEDIGTRFVVRAWPELASVEVAVEDGLVALTDTAHAANEQTTVLRAGQLGRLLRGGRVQVTTDADVALVLTRGQLVFDDRPLSEVLPAIGRRFNVVLRADPALIDRHLTARFTAQSLDDVLSALALSLDVRVTTSGRTYTLAPVAR